MRARDRAGRVLALPNQTPGILRRYGLTRAQADRTAWAIDASGRIYSGAAAVNHVLAVLGNPWRWLAALYRLPPLRWLEDRLYRWVAQNRHRLSALWSTTPECEQRGGACV